MNHIFHSVWSEALNTWVAVSELASAKGKRSSSSVLKAALNAAMIADASSLYGLAQNHRLKPIAIALACCFCFGAQANPLGAQVVNGSAAITQAGNVLTVTNTPNAIINWQGFSIGAGETTRFVQQSASSAVLNRVIGADPSVLLGSMSSNGRVFLINPAGILVGPGARIDVAGLVASTLNLSNADFLASRLNFGASPNAGVIQNNGTIVTPEGGTVYLVATRLENNGVITTPKGETILAAGNAVQLIDTGTPGVTVKITGSDNIVTNLGQLLADSGQIGMVGALVKNSGVINANSLVSQGGKVFLRASNRVEAGGTITSNGNIGGDIALLGKEVGVMDAASVSANGTLGGGTVLVGGDYQGKNPDVQNAQVTYVASTANISADATQNGNGGKLIVWSDITTRAYGNLSARGGMNGGNGGLIETSGHYLDVSRINVDASASNGASGGWLLDPINVTITTAVDAGGSLIVGQVPNPSIWSPSLTGSNISNTTIQTALNAGTSVTINTTGTVVPAELGDITVNAAIAKTSGAAATLTLNASNNIVINQPISSTIGALNLTLNHGAANSATLASSLSLLGGNVDVQSAGVTGAGTLNVTVGTTTLTGALAANTLNLSGGTLNLSSVTATTLPNLTMNSGTLGGTGAVTVTGPFNVTGSSTLNGTGIFTTQGVSTVSMAVANGYLTVTGGANWVNQGTLTVGGDDFIWFGSFTGIAGINTLSNAAGGIINFSSSNLRLVNQWNGTNTLNNAGTLNQTLTGSHEIIVALNNTGTVNVNAGTLQVSGGGTNTGIFNTAAGTTLEFSGGTNILNAGASLTGTGSLVVSGWLDINTPLTLANLTLNGGAVGGTGALTVTGPFNVTATSELNSKGTFTTLGTTTVNMAVVNGYLMNWGGGWVNQGSLTIGGDDFIYFGLSSGGVVNTLSNAAGGIINLNSSNATPLNNWNGTNTLDNAGTLNQTLAGNHAIGIALNNTGTVNVNAGTLQVGGGGTDTGIFNTALGTSLEFSGGISNLNAGASLTGTGSLAISGGTLNLNTPFTLANLTMSGGTLGGTGALTVTGPFNVTGFSTLSSTGTFTTQGVTTVNIAAVNSYLGLGGGVNWVNQGALTVGGSSFLYFGAGTNALTNAAGGTINLSSSYATPMTSAGANTLNNSGTLNQTLAGNPTLGIAVTNTGVVNVAAGTLQIGNMFNLNAGTSITGAGFLEVANAGTLNINTPFTLANLTMSGGTLGGTGALTVTGPFNVTGFSTLSSTGTFTTQGVTTVNIAAVNSYLGLGGGVNWVNQGALTVGGSSFLYFGAGTNALTNAAGGTINLSSSYATPMTSAGANTLNNSGTLNQTLAGNPTLGIAVTNTGVVNVAAGTLQIGNMFNLNAGTSITGAGFLEVANAGTLNINTPFTLANLTMSGGTLGGTGALTVTGPFNVTGFSTLSSTGTFTTQGVTTVNIAAVNSYLGLGGGVNWVNQGALTVGGSSFLYFGAGTNALTNAAGGTINLSSSYATPMTSAGANTLNNSGTLNQTLAGNPTLGIAVTNTGVVNVAAGTLQIGNMFNLNAGTSITGAGFLEVANAGTLNINTPFTLANLAMSGGTLAGAAALTVTGPFNVTGPSTLSSTGAFTTQGVTTVNMAQVNGYLSLTGGVNWVNQGTLTVGGDDYIWFGASVLGASTLTNAAAGIINLSSSNVTPLANWSGTNTLNNAGILNQTLAGSHTIGIALNNTGTVNVTAGTLDVTGALTQSGTMNVSAGTIFNKAAGFTSTGTIAGSGTIAVGAGVASLINNGTLNPGGTGAAGTLKVTGDLQLGATSILNVELGGTAAGLSDSLAVSGNIATAGTLNASLIGGYLPANADFVPFMGMTGVGSTATGTFASASLPLGFNAGYNLAAGEATRLIYAAGTGTSTFTNALGGLDWATPGNWSGGALPGTLDAALISAGLAVTHVSGVDNITALTINALNSLDVSGGSLTVSGITTLGGTLNVSGTGSAALNGALNGGTAGVLNVSAGSLNLGGAAAVNTLNLTGGTVNGTGSLTVGNNYSQTLGALGNTFSSVNINQTVGNLAVGTLGATGVVNLTSTAGTLTVNGPIAASGINGKSASGVTLAATGTLTASGTGNAIVLNAGSGSFINNAGATALTASAGRWLVYSADPALDTFGGLLSGNLAVWGKTAVNYAPVNVVEAGNRYLFSAAPALAVSVANQAKTYGTDLTLTPYAATVTGLMNAGLYGGVFLQDATTGVASITSAGFAVNAPVNAAVPYAITVAAGTLAAPAGYSVTTYTNGQLTVNPFALTVTATGVNRVYDATNLATITLADNRFVWDAATLTTSSGAATFLDKNVANSKAVSVTGIALAGAAAGNYTFNTTAATTGNITPAALSVSGITANSKVYDGLTSATLNTAASGFTGMLAGDVLTVGAATGAFVDKNVATGKIVNITGISLGGASAGNYTFNTTAATTANITAKALTIAATGVNKVYDGGLIATETLADNRIAGDVLTLGLGTANYLDKNVANAKVINVSGLTLTGIDAGNYTFNTTAATTANITAKALTIAATGVNKVYDGGLIATETLTDNRIAGDVLTLGLGTASYLDKNVANAKVINVSGLTLTGIDAGNYTFNTTAATTANITAKALTIAATGVNKVYDGGLIATETLTDNRIAGDVLTLGLGTASYLDKNVANAKVINVSGLTLTGIDAGNYTFNTTAATTANITPALITAVTGITSTSKVYDGLTSATLATATTGFTGMVAGDALTVGTATGTFVDKNVAVGKVVNIAGITLGGANAGNYTLASSVATTTGTITVRPLATWTGLGGNLLWSNPLNWDALPDLNNVVAVTIPALANVTYDASMAGITSLQSLTSGGLFSLAGGTLSLLAGGTGLTAVGYAQSGGTLNGSGNFTVSNSYSQLGGVMALNNAVINITQAAGDIIFTNTGIVTISGMNALTGNINLNNTGAVSTTGPVSASLALTLAAHSPLTIGNTVTTGGNIALSAGATAGGVADILTINGLVNSTAGSISLSAGNGIVQNILASAPLGTVSLLANQNNPAPVVVAPVAALSVVVQQVTTVVTAPVVIASPASSSLVAIAPNAVSANPVTTTGTTGTPMSMMMVSGGTIGGTQGTFGGADPATAIPVLTTTTMAKGSSGSNTGSQTSTEASGDGNDAVSGKIGDSKENGKENNKGKISAKPEKC